MPSTEIFTDPLRSGFLKKIIFAFSVTLRGFTHIRGMIYERALKAELANKGFICHPSTLLIGELFGKRLTFGEGIWIGVYSIVFIGDDPGGGASFARIDFGHNIHIGDHCNIRAAGGTIKIGSNVLIANHVTMVASNHGYYLDKIIVDQKWSSSPLDVEIGNDCWIGANVTLLPGTRISDGAIIAAGSVVRSLVPQNEIWGGVPARKISERRIEPSIAQ